jgi:DNA-binding transcriptional LysR family regulator
MPPTSPWTGVEHRHLAALDAIARTGSFRGAATALGYSQSAVSQLIAQLEHALGAELVARDANRLTAAGRALVEHAAPILASFRAALADVAALGAPLRVGVSPHLAAPVLAGVLPPFLQRHPDTEVEVIECDDAGAAIEHGAVDVALGDPPAGAAIALRRLEPEPYMLVDPPSWAVVRRGVEPELLEQLPLLRWDRGPEGARVESDLRARGIAPRFVADTHATELPRLLAAGAGAAIVPACAAPPGATRAALDALVAPRAVAVAWHRDRRLSSAARALADAAGRTRVVPERIGAAA